MTGELCFALGAGGLAACAAASLLALTERRLWLGELVNNFRWQLGWVTLGCASLLALAGTPGGTGSAALLALHHLGPGLRLWLPRPRSERGRAGGEVGALLRVAVANVNAGSRDLASVRAWLAAERLDLLVLLEATHTWRAALDDLAPELPHRVESDSRPEFGIVLLSRRPLASARVVTSPFRGRQWIEAELEHGGARLQVLALHPERPGRAWRIRDRDGLLGHVARTTDFGERTLVLADLNATLYSHAFRDFCRAAGLADTRRGFGRLPTWRADRYVKGLRLDLDHVLVRGELAVVERRTGPGIGSDHRPACAVLRT